MNDNVMDPFHVQVLHSTFSGIQFHKWGEMTEEEHQRFPGDIEAQAGQGPISLHSEEHLVTSDRGIMMQRHLLEQQMDVVARGGTR